jgi:hypothetical protein
MPSISLVGAGQAWLVMLLARVARESKWAASREGEGRRVGVSLPRIMNAMHETL